MRRVCILVSALGLFAFTTACTYAADQGVKLEEVSTRESAQQQAFKAWLDELKTEAGKQGVSDATLTDAFANVKIIPKVIEYDRKQPEKTIGFLDYVSRTIPASRVRKGKRLFQENRMLLEEVSKKYNVQPQYIVALWGVETDFGKNSGKFRVIDALATLAYEGRRAEFFRTELLNALVIMDQKHITSDQLRGSWAGAMGQTQFMPSSYLKYAVDFDSDGHVDIWSSKADIFASIANYLAANGWKNDERWGSRVVVPEALDIQLVKNQTELPLSQWKTNGLKLLNNQPLQENGVTQAVLVYPEDQPQQALLVYTNFKVLKTWNRSTYFAGAVGMLADAFESQ